MAPLPAPKIRIAGERGVPARVPEDCKILSEVERSWFTIHVSNILSGPIS